MDEIKTLHQFYYEVDAYSRSPGLSVGSKLCFSCLHFPIQLFISPESVFSLDMPEMQVSHMYTKLKTAFVMWCKDSFLRWGEGR